MRKKNVGRNGILFLICNDVMAGTPGTPFILTDEKRRESWSRFINAQKQFWTFWHFGQEHRIGSLRELGQISLTLVPRFPHSCEN